MNAGIEAIFPDTALLTGGPHDGRVVGLDGPAFHVIMRRIRDDIGLVDDVYEHASTRLHGKEMPYRYVGERPLGTSAVVDPGQDETQKEEPEMTLHATRSEDGREVTVHGTSGGLTVQVKEHPTHVRHFWGQLGNVLDDAERVLKAADEAREAERAGE